jgi:hypothetical protein
MEEYDRGLREAGFGAVQIVDTGKDLRAYAKMENQQGCCSPPMTSSGLPVVESCCSPDGSDSASIHEDLARLFEKYDPNEYAASVQVYALKSRQ